MSDKLRIRWMTMKNKRKPIQIINDEIKISVFLSVCKNISLIKL